MTPEQEEQVRRVLASAPAEGPMPPEVAARLDATLAELVAHRSPAEQASAVGPAPGQGGEVVDLDERRRRRWPKVLVAAASVSVLAYGVGVVAGGVGGGSDAEMSTATSDSSGVDSDNGAAGGRAQSEEEAAPLPAERDGAATESDVARRQLLTADVVSLRTATLRRDVVRVVDAEAVFSTDDGPKDDRTAAGELPQGLLDRVAARCDVPALEPEDRLSPARLDGRPATLVVRAPTDGTRVAEVYSCDDGTRLLAVTRIPARR